MNVRNLKGFVLKSINVIPMAGDANAPASNPPAPPAEPATPSDDGDSNVPDPQPSEPSPARKFNRLKNIPDDLLDDPDLAADLDALNEPDVKPDDAQVATADPDDKKPVASPADDSANKADDLAVEFENDVSIGDITFGKDNLKNVPIEFIENLAKLKEKLETDSAQIVESKGKLDSIEKDPVIKDRLRRIKEGQADKPYSAYGVSRETNDAIKKALDESGLEESEIAKVLEVVHKEMAIDVEDNVRSYVNNSLNTAAREAHAAKVIERGKETISEIAKMHKELTPEKVREWCTNPARRGKGKDGALSYVELVDMVDRFGVESVYTAIAKEMKLPVVLNSSDRDKAMVSNERERLLNLMGAKTVKKVMSSQQKAVTAPGNKPATILDDGAIDDDKLSDIEYTGALLDGAKDEEDIFRTQAMLKARIMK